MYPGAAEALSRFAAISSEESDFLDEMADSFLAERGTQVDEGLYALDIVPVNRVLVRRALRRLNPEIDYGMLSRLSDLYFAPSGCVKAAGIYAERAGGRLYLMDETLPPEVFLGTLSAVPCENKPVYQNGFRQALDRRAVEGAVLRLRRPGDRISPLGTSGSKSLSDYLTDRKIDRPLRDRIPLLAAGGEILWVVGVGLSNRAALKENSEAVELTYVPKNNGGARHDERPEGDPV